MADIICPECGETNRSEDQVCKFCDAELAPVHEQDDESNKVEPVEERKDTAGPLTGLWGTLPAEESIDGIKKPGPYSVKVQFTESQRANIDLIDDLLHYEPHPKPIPEQPRTTTQRFLRILILLLLILAIVLPSIFGETISPLPEAPPELLALNKYTQVVPPGAPVLLAFDYEPGFSGELDVPASSIIEQLISQQAYLVMLSTIPTGPVQAERVIASTAQRTGTSIQSQEEYINLGFIPGGPIGLSSLSSSLQLALPRAVRGESIWQSAQLESVGKLSDFDMVIVITNSADIARNWIEQIQPNLMNTPMVMVVSAQTEPMVRPYYESTPRQVDALVVGLGGSVSYEQISGGEIISQSYWGSFSLSVIVSAGLILVGAITGLFSESFRGVQKTEEDDQ